SGDEEVPCRLICPPRCYCHRNLCFGPEVQHPVAAAEVENNGPKN
ncbi:hypothetical protein LINGRAPRIM_LOCUS1216, partial [Linum grandiflorum]